MEYKDYYKILAVPRDATDADIKLAYRKLARKHHPDVSKAPDAEARFKEVGEAYAVLKDPEKRAAYDQLGADWKAGQEFQAPPDWDAGFEFRGGPEGYDENDFFSSLFGQQFKRAQSNKGHANFSRGQDRHAKISIELEDAWQGGGQNISLRVPELDASGHLVTRQRNIDVKIPKGIKEGQHIRLTGLGEPSPMNGQAGDLYLEVLFKPHHLYRADGYDLHMDLPVAPWEAALGAQIKVPTPQGSVALKIPANSKAGNKLRLAKRGMPGPTPGDLYVNLQIVLPPAQNERDKAFYTEMAKSFTFNPRPNFKT